MHITEGKIPTFIRGKGKYKVTVAYKDVYKNYIKVVKDSYMPLGTKFEDTRYNVSNSKHSKILKDFHKLIFKKVTEENFAFKLPHRLGVHSVRKYLREIPLDEKGDVKMNDIDVDYKATKLLWASDKEAYEKRIKVYNLNEHTDGYKYFYQWEKKDIIAKGVKIYSFVLCRDNKRALKKAIVGEKTDYYFAPIRKYIK